MKSGAVKTTKNLLGSVYKMQEFSHPFLLGFLISSLFSYLYLARYSSTTKDDFWRIALSGMREVVEKEIDERGKVLYEL